MYFLPGSSVLIADFKHLPNGWECYVCILTIAIQGTINSGYKWTQTFKHFWPVWQNGWVFIYELSGCGFESSCSHLNFRFRTCFEQGVPWHSGKYRVWIHSETHTWNDKNIQWPSIFQKTWQGRMCFYSSLPKYSEKNYKSISGISKKNVTLKFSPSQ